MLGGEGENVARATHGIDDSAEDGGGFASCFAGEEENGRLQVGEHGGDEPSGEHLGLWFLDAEQAHEEFFDGGFVGFGGGEGEAGGGAAEAAGFIWRDGPLFAVDFDGFAGGVLEVNAVGVGGAEGGADVDWGGHGVGVCVLFELAHDGAVLGGAGEEAVLLKSGAEPVAEDGGMEGDGVAGDGDGDVGLAFGGEEEVGAAGDGEEDGVLAWLWCWFAGARRHAGFSPLV